LGAGLRKACLPSGESQSRIWMRRPRFPQSSAKQSVTTGSLHRPDPLRTHRNGKVCAFTVQKNAYRRVRYPNTSRKLKECLANGLHFRQMIDCAWFWRCASAHSNRNGADGVNVGSSRHSVRLQLGRSAIA
jgi:hypothetical protein